MRLCAKNVWSMSAKSNHTLKRLTARMPEQWRGKVSDGKLSSWLRSIPETLPPDPGGGTFRRSFALSAEVWERVKQHAGKMNADPSAWLRRLIATKLGACQASSSAILPIRPQATLSRSTAPSGDTVKPVPVIRRTNRAAGEPHGEDQGKKAFQKYIAELESLVRSGRPEAGEAQVRLVRIREIQAAQQLVDAGPDPQ
jgi:hypothetical protein